MGDGKIPSVARLTEGPVGRTLAGLSLPMVALSLIPI